MGVHFSPCGRFLAGTAACRGPLPAAVAAGGLLGEEEPDGMQRQLDIEAALAAALQGGGDAPAPAGYVTPPQQPSPTQARGAPPLLRAADAAGDLLQRGAGGAAAAAAAAQQQQQQQQQQRPERVVFEVRVWSLDAPDFGKVVRAKR
jgi:hypothetical protein